MPQLKELKTLLEKGLWTIRQIQRNQPDKNSIKTLFEKLPGPLAYTFFINNRLISVESSKKLIIVVSEGFDYQIWTYHLLNEEENEELQPSLERGKD